MTTEQRLNQNASAAQKAAEESFVLLKNENVLPLTTGNPVAVFGVGQIFTIRGGLGSGEVNLLREVNLLDALRKSRLLVPDEPLAELYRAWCAEHPSKTSGQGLTPNIHFNPEYPVPEGIITATAARCNTALVVISRIAGEGADMQCEPGTLLLTPEEDSLLRNVSRAFEHTILILNTPGYMEIAEYTDLADAILFIGLPGQNGGYALANILTGTVSPSGHLSDTWPLQYTDYPNASYYGKDLPNGIFHTDFLGTDEQTEVPYYDDIFVGYRYFDTFQVPVLYPFGYGLTYGMPEITDSILSLEKRTISISVSVTNASPDTACRQVVQVYASQPSTVRAVPSHILIAYGKTGILQPGKSETLTLECDIRALASYDESSACYMLDPGDYEISVGTNSRDTIAIGALRAEQSISVEKLKNCLGSVPAGFKPLTPDLAPSEAHKYAIIIDPSSVKPLKPSYPKPYVSVPAPAEHVTLRDVADGNATFGQLTAQFSEDELLQLVCGVGMDLSGFEKLDDPNMVIPGQDASQSITLHVPGAAGETYDLWDRYRIPYTTLADGPSGLRLRLRLPGFEDDPSRSQRCTAFPTGSILACSWDPSVLDAVGKAVALEMETFKVDMWLAPGMNIHRSPLCGRNFEYYSEDPLLCGKCAAAITRGVASVPGRTVTLKHFAGNSQEYKRSASTDIISERAMREIYLRGFEIAVKEGRPYAVMTAYNDINGVPCANNYDLTTSILRGEWKFDGLVMTDWGGGISNPALSMWAGNDLIMPGGEDSRSLIRSGLDQCVENPGAADFSTTVTRAMLECCAIRILRFVLRSEPFARRCAEEDNI